MNPSYLYAALLDVLGYRFFLERDRQSGRLDFQEKLSAALAALEAVNEAVFGVRAISDTVILTCSEHEHFPEFLELLRGLFVAFLGQGIFIRGGVAFAQHFQNGRLTYSQAIAKAYELESKVAGYPRIVIDKNIVAMYETGSGLPEIASSGLICVENGVYFLDILTPSNWQQVYSCAKNLHVQSTGSLLADDPAFGKHIRFERYLRMSRHAPTAFSPFIGGIESV
jgi:hypothetical protein